MRAAKDFFAYPTSGDDAGNGVYLKEAISWICRAQDATGDDGVAHSFRLRQGWTTSYPETTGYIIPTMFNASSAYDDRSLMERALRMADWLVRIQLDCGAIQAGIVSSAPPTPTVFNTGQVLFGWVRAFEETGNHVYLAAAVKAANWLVEIQDPDGVWRRWPSPYVRYRVSTCNTKTAWALHRLYEVTGRVIYRDACLRNVAWALTQQTPTGWFEQNCFETETTPLMHTIAYTVRGLLEVGIVSENSSVIEAARKVADALLIRLRSDGSLAGKYAEDWTPAVSWSCLTGNAQMSIVWGRLYQRFQEPAYLAAMQKANRFLRSTIDLSTSEPGVRGGISGSWPRSGDYGRFNYPNWAAKFFVDALMLENALTGDGGQALVLNG